MTFLEKHDYDKTCMDSKRKRHKHMIGTIKKTAIKLKKKPKNRKVNNKNYRAFELKCNTTCTVPYPGIDKVKVKVNVGGQSQHKAPR